MYQDYWGLSRPVFSLAGEPNWYFLSPTHEEAQARIEFLVEHHRRLGILVGPSGVGKTMSLNYFVRQARRRAVQTVNLSVLGMDYDEFLWRVATRLGAAPGETGTITAAWQAIQDRLSINHFQNLATVIFVDDAEQAEHDVLRAIQRLVQAETGSAGRLTLLLAVESGRSQLLGQRLLELCELKIEMEHWDVWQLANFLEWALERAGRRGPVFTSAAVHRLHQISQGQPRRTVQLAELALIAGAAQQLTTLDEELISSTAEQLTLAPSAAPSWL